jgi:SAM-dependent methyltransferase
VTDEYVDIHKLAAEIEAEVRARRAAGEYPPGFERELDRLFDRFAPPEVSNDFDAALERAEDLVIVDPVIPVASNSPVLGIVKRVMSKLLGWYHVWLAQQISALSTAINTALRLLGGRVVDLEHITGDVARARGVWNEIVVGALRGGSGRIAVLECGEGVLLETLAGAGLDAYGVEPRATVADVALARGLEVRIDDGAAHLHAVGAAALGGLVLRGLVERAPLGELLLLVDAAAAKLAPGGRLVVCSLRREAWGIGETAAEADLVAGHPLHPDTWSAVLPEQGFADVQVHGEGAGAYVVTAIRSYE